MALFFEFKKVAFVFSVQDFGDMFQAIAEHDSSMTASFHAERMGYFNASGMVNRVSQSFLRAWFLNAPDFIAVTKACKKALSVGEFIALGAHKSHQDRYQKLKEAVLSTGKLPSSWVWLIDLMESTKEASDRMMILGEMRMTRSKGSYPFSPRRFIPTVHSLLSGSSKIPGRVATHHLVQLAGSYIKDCLINRIDPSSGDVREVIANYDELDDETKVAIGTGGFDAISLEKWATFRPAPVQMNWVPEVVSCDKYICPENAPLVADAVPLWTNSNSRESILTFTTDGLERAEASAHEFLSAAAEVDIYNLAAPLPDFGNLPERIMGSKTSNLNVPKGESGRDVTAEDYLSKLLQKMSARASKTNAVKSKHAGLAVTMSEEALTQEMKTLFAWTGGALKTVAIKIECMMTRSKIHLWDHYRLCGKVEITGFDGAYSIEVNKTQMMSQGINNPIMSKINKAINGVARTEIAAALGKVVKFPPYNLLCYFMGDNSIEVSANSKDVDVQNVAEQKIKIREQDYANFKMIAKAEESFEGYLGSKFVGSMYACDCSFGLVGKTFPNMHEPILTSQTDTAEDFPTIHLAAGACLEYDCYHLPSILAGYTQLKTLALQRCPSAGTLETAGWMALFKMPYGLQGMNLSLIEGMSIPSAAYNNALALAACNKMARYGGIRGCGELLAAAMETMKFDAEKDIMQSIEANDNTTVFAWRLLQVGNDAPTATSKLRRRFCKMRAAQLGFLSRGLSAEFYTEMEEEESMFLKALWKSLTSDGTIRPFMFEKIMCCNYYAMVRADINKKSLGSTVFQKLLPSQNTELANEKLFRMKTLVARMRLYMLSHNNPDKWGIGLDSHKFMTNFFSKKFEGYEVDIGGPVYTDYKLDKSTFVRIDSVYMHLTVDKEDLAKIVGLVANSVGMIGPVVPLSRKKIKANVTALARMTPWRKMTAHYFDQLQYTAKVNPSASQIRTKDPKRHHGRSQRLVCIVEGICHRESGQAASLDQARFRGTFYICKFQIRAYVLWRDKTDVFLDKSIPLDSKNEINSIHRVLESTDVFSLDRGTFVGNLAWTYGAVRDKGHSTLEAYFESCLATVAAFKFLKMRGPNLQDEATAAESVTEVVKYLNTCGLKDDYQAIVLVVTAASARQDTVVSVDPFEGMPRVVPRTRDTCLNTSINSSQHGHMIPTSGLLVPGGPRPGYGLFESIYGQWKRQERTDAEIVRSFGAQWLTLFRQSIYQKLPEILDMQDDKVERDSEVAEPINRPYNTGSMGTRVPVHVVSMVHSRWLQGGISDSTIEQIYGAHWLRMFRIWRDHGLPECRRQFPGLVDWDDVADMGDSTQQPWCIALVPDDEQYQGRNGSSGDGPEPQGEQTQYFEGSFDNIAS
ncbi:unnamed protein product [Symbiodinium sp. CCMP2592]|nr:unnamed protein product [Symbiodinium sp. CCMP2592]